MFFSSCMSESNHNKKGTGLYTCLFCSLFLRYVPRKSLVLLPQWYGFDHHYDDTRQARKKWSYFGDVLVFISEFGRIHLFWILYSLPRTPPVPVLCLSNSMLSRTYRPHPWGACLALKLVRVSLPVHLLLTIHLVENKRLEVVAVGGRGRS